MKKRRRRRKLKKGFKILFITIPIIAAIVLIIVFGFKLQTVKVTSDLKQYTEAEVKACMDANEIDNTFIFWLRNKIGKSQNIDLFEQYSVKMNSPTKVTINAYEKKLKGYIKDNDVNLYFDRDGKILKITSEKLESIPRITGLKYDSLKLYKVLGAKDEKALNTLLKVTKAIEEYDFGVKKINISDDLETTLYIKKIQVQLGKESNLDKKLSALNDMYSNVIKYKGVLNMKRVSTDGSYTMQRTDIEKKK